jgi:hypothetical protein
MQAAANARPLSVEASYAIGMRTQSFSCDL